MDLAQCSLCMAYRPTNKLPRNVPPRIERKYPMFMVMTPNML